VFQIPTAKFGTVFMRVSAPEQGNAIAVVEVDADRLLGQWRRTSGNGSELEDSKQASWPSDEKFAAAEMRFMEGQFDPVPLAFMSCREANDGSPQLSLADGITRTIWLLTAGATVFPVSCSIDDATALEACAGAAGSRVRTTADLLSPSSHEQYMKELRAAERMQARRILRDFAQSG
jgi:hypothetical protein